MTHGISTEVLNRWRKRTFVVAGAAAVVSSIGAFAAPEHFFRAYLLSFVFALALPLGSLAIAMLFHLVGGEWAWLIRNCIESAKSLFPVMIVLFLPLLLGLKTLYPWARADGLAELGPEKRAYYNVAFVITRTVVYFGMWMGFSAALGRNTRKGAVFSKKLRVMSAWGLVAYFLTMSFAAIDWLMSLDPNWISTVYGGLIITGQILTALSILVLFVGLVAPTELEQQATKSLHDLGNLLLTFVLLWAYLAFMQYLVIWSGNLREEIPWYLNRSRGAWPWIALALLVLHFVVPFLLLLSRANKRKVRRLSQIAAILLAARLLDLFWQIGPLPNERGAPLHWVYVTTPIAIAGIVFGCFLSRLRSFDTPLLLRQREEVLT